MPEIPAPTDHMHQLVRIGHVSEGLVVSVDGYGVVSRYLAEQESKWPDA